MKKLKQAGAELGQAQLKLGFEFTLNFSIFGFSRSSNKIEKIIQWSPLWIIFKIKIKIAHLLPERSARQDNHILKT